MTKKITILTLFILLYLPIIALAQNTGNTGRISLQSKGNESSAPSLESIKISGTLLKQIEEKGFATVYIGFASNSIEILPDYQDEIQGIYQLLLQQEDLCLLLIGHTDSTGNTDYNKDLSLKRATAVKAALAKLGINGERLTVDGKGPDQPIADNRTATGRELNRRVELHKRACLY